MKSLAKIKVQQPAPPEAPIEKPILAKAIVDIGAAARKLTASGLNRRAVILLLADSSGVRRTACAQVLNALERLAQDYCK